MASRADVTLSPAARSRSVSCMLPRLALKANDSKKRIQHSYEQLLNSVIAYRDHRPPETVCRGATGLVRWGHGAPSPAGPRVQLGAGRGPALERAGEESPERRISASKAG